jgi:hypothetical protein
VPHTEQLNLELNGETVASLVHGGWGIHWDRVRRQARVLNVPRDCWIAQLLMEAWRQGRNEGVMVGRAAAQDACPGCAHEPDDPREVQQQCLQQRTLADYLAGATDMPRKAPEMALGAVELARAIRAPAAQQTGLRANLGGK